MSTLNTAILLQEEFCKGLLVVRQRFGIQQYLLIMLNNFLGMCPAVKCWTIVGLGILSCHKRQTEFSSRLDMLIDLRCIPSIPFTDRFCMFSVKEITETISTPVNEKMYSFRLGPNSGLIDIMAWQQFIQISHKLLLVTACALKPEPAAIYLLICIMLTLSEAIALISSAYYCTHQLHKESNLTQFTSAAGVKKERGSFLLWEWRGQTESHRSAVGHSETEGWNSGLLLFIRT